MRPAGGSAERLAGVLLRALPADHREWGEAVAAEFRHLPGRTERLRWLLGAARLVGHEHLPGLLRVARFLGVAVGLSTLVAWADFRISDLPAVLALLVLAAAAIGAAWPARARSGGVIVGTGIAAAHATWALCALPVPPGHPGTLVGSAGLLVLALPALAAACAAARLRSTAA